MGKNETKRKGHLLGSLCALVWGSTFVLSKRLMAYYTPAQLMLMRFVAAWAVLWCLHPRWKRPTLREELRFLALGVTGCTLYFWSENTALTLTSAANVSTIVAMAPLFTALLVHFTTGERLGRRLWLGFAAAFAGVVLVVFNGAFVLRVSPAGDLLSLFTAALWAVFTVQQARQLRLYSGLYITRKVMFYGILTSLPLAFARGPFSLEPLLTSGGNLAALLFLAVLGSALCYVAWAGAERALGAVTVTGYVYVIPFVTMAASALFLREPIAPAGVLGAVLIVAGVWFASRREEEREGTA